MMNKFTAGLVGLFGLLGMLAYFVFLTIESRSMVGAYALGIVSTLGIGGVFWVMQLVNTWLQNSWEQKRFQDNAKENYANTLAQQKLQNEQTKGALLLAADARKQLPDNSDNNGNYLVFDESAFDDLESE
jgi:hypothetical protein